LNKGPAGIIYPPAYHTTPLQGGGYITEKESGEGWMLLWGDDNSITNYLGHSAVFELTKKEAMAYSEAHQDRILKVTDQAVVDLLKIKAQIGQKFNKEEEAALDPDNPQGGFARNEIFADLILKHE
jgi:hypothetical protein